MNRSNKYLNRMLFSISVSMLNRPCLLGVVLHWFSLCVCGVEKFSDKGRFHCISGLDVDRFYVVSSKLTCKLQFSNLIAVCHCFIMCLFYPVTN